MSRTKNKKNLVKPDNAIGSESDVDVFVLKIVIAVSAVFSVLATVLFDKTNQLNGIAFAIFGFSVVIAVAVYLGINKKLTTQNIIILLFAAGFVIRLNYILGTYLTNTRRVRQHDLYKFGGEKGHSAYIEHFYNNGFTMPDFDPTTKAQFYHPPLHHFLSALWMRLLTTFNMSYDRAISSLQFLTLFYSMCFLVVAERTLDKLKLRGLGKIIPLAIITFHPTFIIFSGSVNNDNLSTLFTLLAFYAALAWEKEPIMKNIMLIAVSVGLGMSTKLSVALITPAIAIIFLDKVIYNGKNFVSYFKQFVAFAFVCLPLGLWFYVRNSVKFDVPITYVPRLSETSDQYVGYHTTYERLFDFSYHPFKNIFMNRVVNGEGEYFEYNPFVSIIKSSVFGEYNFSETVAGIVPFCRILLILNVILIAISIAAAVYCTVRKSSFMNTVQRIFIVFYYILSFVFYVKFAFQYPHTCSMDYRYIPMTCVIGSIFIGMAFEEIKFDFPEKDNIINPIRHSVIGITSLFCITSVLVCVILCS